VPPMLAHARRRVMVAAERLGVDSQVKQLRALTDKGMRRDLRDHEAFRFLLAATVRADSHTIDVGAHAGDVLGEMLRLSPRGRHLAYEPIPYLFAQLAARFPAAELRNAALSDQSGISTFQHVVDMPGVSGLRRRGGIPADARIEEIEVTVERLDDTLPEGFAPSFIKIDVEGAELQVMLGAERTIARHRPLIAFEHGAQASDHYGTTPRMMHEFLAGNGYRIFDFAGVGPYDADQFEAVFDQPIWNFLAVPA
jgi:FkbM family methyltransferase